CQGNTNSSGWSGIHPARVQGDGGPGINNPLRVRGIYADPDGRNDLDYLKAWVSNDDDQPSGSSPNNIRVAAYGSLRYLGSNNYRLAPNGRSEVAFSLGSNSAICTMAGSNIQQICDINNLPGTAIGYAHPVNIAPSGNQVVVDWDMGMLDNVFSSATFDDIRYDVRAEDDPGDTSGWVFVRFWDADLNPPVVTTDLTITSDTTLDVNNTDTDANMIIIREKACTAANNQRGISMARTNPASGSVFFPPGGATFDPCIDTLEGNISYEVDNIPKDGSLNFLYWATDLACNKSPSDATNNNVALKPPWLVTTEGDEYSTNSIQQTSLANVTIVNGLLGALNNTRALLSTYNFMQSTNLLPARDSELDYVNNGYTDLNGKPRDEFGFPDWYSFLENRVDINFDGTAIRTLAPNQNDFTNTNTNTIGGVGVGGPAGTTFKDRVNIVKTQGDLNLDRVTCNSKTVFLVNGDLTISPDFTISDNLLNPSSGLGMNGCFFAVSGTTTIQPGTDKVSANPVWTPYDEVHAFIVTDSFKSQPDLEADGLKITGGVITNQNNEFLRDNGTVLNQFSPSELFIYDGGRYIHLFEDVLDMPVEFTIQEKPFIESISDHE
ncbi:MAG: hypothetical protein ACE5DX_00475, partial [Candidatus Dojkabacteria bacterium]